MFPVIEDNESDIMGQPAPSPPPPGFINVWLYMQISFL